MSHSIKQSRAQQLAEHLREQIRSGGWINGGLVPSIREIARLYNVGSHTAQLALRELEEDGFISRTANSQATVSYSPVHLVQSSAHAEGLLKNITLPHIGLIGFNPLSLYPDRWEAHILQAVEMELTKAASFYLTRICPLGFNSSKFADNMLTQVNEIAPQLSGAIIFQMDTQLALQVIEKLDQSNVPWIFIGQPHWPMLHNLVSLDNIALGHLAGRCFVLNNFERVVILSIDFRRPGSAANKASGLIRAYLEEKRPTSGIEYVYAPSAKWHSGRDAIMQYLQNHAVPQAIFASGDYLALGAMSALQDKGISVPEKVSIIGSTGLDVAEMSNPPLAVVTQPMQEMGHSAAQMLLEMLSTGERRLPGRHLMGRLVARASLALSASARMALIREGVLEESLDDVSVSAG